MGEEDSPRAKRARRDAGAELDTDVDGAASDWAARVLRPILDRLAREEPALRTSVASTAGPSEA
eukprot:7001526-Pyramimonas_sp.AAC.1